MQTKYKANPPSITQPPFHPEKQKGGGGEDLKGSFGRVYKNSVEYGVCF